MKIAHSTFIVITFIIMLRIIYRSLYFNIDWITGLAFSINLIAFIALILTRKYL